MTIPEILRAAAARIRQGWCQKALEWDGGVCLIGAVNTVLYGDVSRYDEPHPNHYKALECLRRALGLDDFDALLTWNNAPDQTAEGVAVGLEFAALVYEQEQLAAAPVERSGERISQDAWERGDVKHLG